MAIEEAVWYVAAAYAVVLVVLLALFWYLARQTTALARQVSELRRLTESREQAADPPEDR